MQLGKINLGRQVLELKPRIGMSLLFKAFEWPLNNMSGYFFVDEVLTKEAQNKSCLHSDIPF